MSSIQPVSPRDLQNAVADLQVTKPYRGLIKFTSINLLNVLFLTLALTTDHVWLTVVLTMITGVLAGSVLIMTHDAIHHTMTGNKILDEVLPRLLAYPFLWFHGTYGQIHKIHHKMNGDDLNDPERVQLTEEEVQSYGALGRFYVKYQWFIDLFVFGGIGLILKTLKHAFRYTGKSKQMRRAVFTDTFFIVSVNGALYGYLSQHGLAFKWFLMWLLLERIVGAITQWRAHIEHYGLWGKGKNFYETQVLNCRNIKTSPLTSWYVNHLNFHTVHHAFPKVPFYLLEEAHKRFQALYKDAPGLQLVEADGYLKTTLQLAFNPSVIQQPSSSRGRVKGTPSGVQPERTA